MGTRGKRLLSAAMVLCGASVWAADPSFDVGDRVEYEHRGEWLPAEVIEQVGTRMYRIRLDDADVRPQERGALVSKLRRLGGRSAKSDDAVGDAERAVNDPAPPPVKTVDLAARARPLPAGSTGWGLPQPIGEPATLRAPRRPIRLQGGSNSFHEQPAAVCLAPAIHRVVIAHLDKPPREDPQTTLEIVNLGNRPGDTLETAGELLDVARDGETALLRRETKVDTFDYVWTFVAVSLDGGDETELKPLHLPAKTSTRLHLARLVGDAQLLIHVDDVLALWSLRRGAVEWAYELPATTRPVLTEDRQLACFAVGASDARLVVLDVASGELALNAPSPLEGRAPQRVALSPDHSRMLLLRGREAVTVATDTGKLISHGELAAAPPDAEIVWLDDACVMIGARSVYDTTRGLTLARVQTPPGGLSATGGGVLWHVQRRNRRERGELVGHAVDAAALRKLPDKVSAAALWSVMPGASIAIETRGQDTAEVRAAVERALTQAGYKIVDHSDIVAVATIRRENGERVEYEGIGASHGKTQTVTQRIVVYELEIKRGGETLLHGTTRDTFGGIGMERPEDGKSVQQVIDQRAQPDAARFGDMYIPERIINPEYADGFTTLRLGE